MTQQLEKLSNHKQWTWLLKILIILLIMPTIILSAIVIDLASNAKNKLKHNLVKLSKHNIDDSVTLKTHAL